MPPYGDSTQADGGLKGHRADAAARWRDGVQAERGLVYGAQCAVHPRPLEGAVAFVPTLLDPPPPLDPGPPVPPSQRRRGFPGDEGGGDEPRSGSSAGPHVAVFGVWISLVPVFMLFGALLVTYVVRKDFSGQWQSLPVPGILWFNTLALLGSSVALERSRRQPGGPSAGFRGYQVAFGLGLVFVVGQVIAWLQYLLGGILASSTPHSGFFYVLTALHAAHVLGGLVGLGLLALWPRHHWTFTSVAVLSRVTAIYWHFLGILWLLMFGMLNFWR
jgi:cytochrome c oxidase subunit 3